MNSFYDLGFVAFPLEKWEIHSSQTFHYTEERNAILTESKK